MATQAPHRPRVSRETRLLFATVIASVVALWVLARLRFPEQAPSVNPVAPVLTQLAPAPAFSDLAALVSDVQSRVLAPFLALPLPVASGRDDPGEHVAALRVRDDLAVALLPSLDGTFRTPQPADATTLNIDRATGLAAVRVAPERAAEFAGWAPAQLAIARYLLCTIPVQDMLALRPVFVSALVAEGNAAWDTTVWRLPERVDVSAGAFAFTTSGAFAGLIVPHGDGLAILPASDVLASVDRLLKQRQGLPGWLGLSVQTLTPDLSAASGAPGGVIVTWVDPRGPAAGSIQIADILETMDEVDAQLTEERYTARTARLIAGDAITFRVRRGQMAQPVRLTAVERPRPADALGLVMRRVRDGAEVLRVEPASAAATAGVREGDVITFAGGVQAPTPAQVTRAFAAEGAGRSIVIGVTRGASHMVLPVNKP